MKPSPKGKGASLWESLPSGSETILIVEDEELVRSIALQVLNNLGYHILSAADGVEGLEIIHDFAEPIDLIVCDIIMPRAHGPEFIARARGVRDDFKVLYASGFSKDTFCDAFNDHADERGEPLLPKPYTPEVLAQTVRNILDHELDKQELVMS